jgi:hypothetical protein
MPRLSGLNFASDEIIKALVPKNTTVGGEFVLVELTIGNEIREIVADYIADRCSRVPPKEFRGAIRAFQKALDIFLDKFPGADSALAEALNQQLDQADDTSTPHLAAIRDGLGILRTAVEALAKAESGAGTDAHREGHLLVKGLANIYEKYRRKKPSKKIDGPFGHFVEKVNEQIPEAYRLTGLEHLLRTMG